MRQAPSIASLGVNSFGLLFDDIPADLQHPEDREAFDSLADAHLSVANAVFERLPRGSRLTVCPTTHWGTGTEPYLSTLGGGLEPGIDLFWTGRAICSPTLDVRDAATFERTARRPATYWDNYPVNDVAMGFELHIGPYRGRDPHLFRHAFGVVANGMELYEASKIPIATIADYLMAPEKYDAEKSWRRAMRDVVGDRDLDDFALFADNVRSSCLSPDDAPVVTRALETFAFGIDQGAGRLAASDLGTLANRLLAAADAPAAWPGREPGAHRRVPAVDRGVRDRRPGAAPDRRPVHRGTPGEGWPGRAAAVPRSPAPRAGSRVRRRARHDPRGSHQHARPARRADARRARLGAAGSPKVAFIVIEKLEPFPD